MRNGPLILDAQLPRHAEHSNQKPTLVSIVRTNPFAAFLLLRWRAVRDKEGKPYRVRCDWMNALLLNEDANAQGPTDENDFRPHRRQQHHRL
jgi:uncharacterized protein YqjF (DUF2071 family)